MDGHNQILRYLTFTLPLLSSTFGSEVYVSCATTILRYQDGHFTQPIKQGLGRVVSLAVDSDLGILFWSDVSAAKRGIYRTKIGDFTKVERIISDVDVVNGIGLDPGRGHVYWTDESRGTLEVARYDGTDRVVLLVDQFGLPRGVAVQATDGYLFWGDQGTGHIHRSRLDGSERAILLNDTIWPNAVVWDSYRSSLLWVDGWTNKMMASTGDGDTQAIFSDLSILTNESSLFGLTVDSGQYMATLRDGRIFLLSTNGELSRVMEVGDLQNCTDLFAIVARRTEEDVNGAYHLLI
ncbi:low-density lipoprotein receptor-related protein 4-like [Liolophura sinensis]|uniref:low-density lipoprotein receptor-related protein 4-like n=1 Tax=Liolophura sinensis TaxID=3198878 RepID=UPI003158587A